MITKNNAASLHRQNKQKAIIGKKLNTHRQQKFFSCHFLKPGYNSNRCVHNPRWGKID